MAYVDKHGDGWRIVYRQKGDSRKLYEPCSGARTKAEAREMMTQFLQRRWREEQGIELSQRDLPGTLGQLAQWWLDERCPKASIEGGATAGLRLHVVEGEVGKVLLAHLRGIDLDNLIYAREVDGAMPGTLNNLRSQLHTVFEKAKKAGKWVGDNPVKGIERRKVAKRAYLTLTPAQVGMAIMEVPEDWQATFASSPALGLRKGEIFGARKIDVDTAHWTLNVCRSHKRDVTKGGQTHVLPIPTALQPWIQWQLDNTPGEFLFPAADGSQRPREADPQKILRSALARAGIVQGWEHVCRWCKHIEHAADAEERQCPTCLKTTDGRGNPVDVPRGRKLWPRAIHLPIRFHDLRHTFATELLRRGVDVHRVQRLMRHADVRTTTSVYSHLLTEDLRSAVDAHSPLPGNAAEAAGKGPEILPPLCPHEATAVANGEPASSDFGVESDGYLERETGFEPATLSLGSGSSGLADFSRRSQVVGSTGFSGSSEREVSQDLAGFRQRLPPPCPHGEQADDESTDPLVAILTPPRHLRAFPGRTALFTVREAATHLRVSVDTVYGLIERGDLAAVTVSTRKRIRPEDLEAYLARSTS